MFKKPFLQLRNRRPRKDPKSIAETPLSGRISQGGSAELKPERKEQDCRSEIEDLKRQLAESQAQNEAKDGEIQRLEARLKGKDDLLGRNSMLEEKLTDYLLCRAEDERAATTQWPEPITKLERIADLEEKKDTINGFEDPPQESAPPPVLQPAAAAMDPAEKIQRWLFIERGDLRSVESLLTKYCDLCRSMRLPLDRVHVSGMMMMPHISAYEWKWELWEEFDEREVPNSIFAARHLGDNEPYAQLMKGKITSYRLQGRQETVPSSCAWYTQKRYQDHYVLPMYHCGEFKGTISWSTTSSRGFSAEHIETFEQSLAALSTVLRCHTNDMAMKTLMSRLEQEVTDQTAELANANKSLAEANRQIIRQSQSQLRNFAMMSHEIRTPLNCIIGVSNLLLENDLAADMKESVEMITSSGDLLLAVVDDVLDYSKLASGNVDTKISTTNLSTTINAVVNTITTKASQSGVELRTHFSSDLPVELETDGRRLQQILYNLLGNAVKFGREGKYVDFSMDIVSRDVALNPAIPNTALKGDSDPEDQLVRIAVKDYGKGIQPEEMKNIFQPFQQAATNEPAHGGTGLGLAITLQLVRVLGGTISVESEYGSWCEFVLFLPKDPERPIEPMPTPEEVVPHFHSADFSLEHNSYLDMEDGSLSTFDESSFSTRASSSVFAQSISVYTPTMSITSDAKHAVPSTVMMGSKAGPSDVKIGTALDAPVEDVTPNAGRTKTVSIDPQPKKLFSEKLPADEEKNEAPHQAQTSEFPSAVDVDSFDYERAKILIAEDNKINQKVLNRTLNRIGIKEIDIVDNGQMAVDAYEGAKSYDIIFMDLQMPVMDGLEATKVITSKREEKGESFPKVVFLTAHALQDYQDKAQDAGGDGFISKPFKLPIIKELIARLASDPPQNNS